MHDIINRAKSVLTAPRTFFKGLGKEKGVKTAFRYYAILAAFYAVLGIIVSRLFQPVASSAFSSLLNIPAPQQSVPMVTLVVSSVLGYALGLGLGFAGAGLLHLWILLWGGTGQYAKTYQLSTYASTPTFVAGWIPIVNIVTSIYGLVLYIIGTQEVHKISKKRSILMYVIPVVLFLALWAGAMLLVLAKVKTLA